MSWHGVFKIGVSADITAEERAKCLAIVTASGMTPNTDKPHLKTQVRPSLNEKKYIIEAARETTAPDIEWVRQGIADYTDITKARADVIIETFYLYQDKAEARSDIAANDVEWNDHSTDSE